MLTYDPRSISSKVYKHLSVLKSQTPDNKDQKEQKIQAVELYTYVATWGLFRLKAEEFALTQKAKVEVVQCFFKTLEEIVFSPPDPIPPQPVSSPINSSVEAPRRPTPPNPPTSFNSTTQPQNNNNNSKTLLGQAGLNYINTLGASEYLGLTGLALKVTQEFSFWTEAIYPKDKKTNQITTETTKTTS